MLNELLIVWKEFLANDVVILGMGSSLGFVIGYNVKKLIEEKKIKK